MNEESFNKNLLNFLQQSPTQFHAVANMAQQLLARGFEQINEADEWNLTKGRGYLVTRNDSAIIAFYYGGVELVETGTRLFGAHTDSPCLKVKPNPLLKKSGLLQFGVEVYGGVLLNPWFDRDLSLAGKVYYESSDGELHSTLIDFKRAIASIPSLAIHLDREANENRTVNKQLHIPPILSLHTDDSFRDFHQWLQMQLVEIQFEIDVVKVCDYELSFYDVQPPAVIGLNSDFIASARLDNLLSCYIGLDALLSCNGRQSAMLVCTDHEEVGSASSAGADGPFLQSVLERLVETDEAKARMIARSMLISADNAHAVHPNYAHKHDGNHGPALNKGPVIKLNANQRYATNGETAAIFSRLCDQEDVPVQRFVMRSDMACGSTIGPITAANIGVKAVDVGVPQLAMHSIRELAGSKDSWLLAKVAKRFFEMEKV
jgi:aspartyl aminopeptidase|tara:strand:- start:758 stop:2053 length:1296 start_codon:yes stop_codon:yes gene_type:complete